jgi:hypothetical protein
MRGEAVSILERELAQTRVVSIASDDNVQGFYQRILHLVDPA